MKTFNDFLQEPDCVDVLYVSLQDIEKYRVIDTCKKSSNIAFKHPRRSGVVMRNFSPKGAELINRTMCALTFRQEYESKINFRSKYGYKVR